MASRVDIVAVSGFPGSGTSTACRLLSERLGWHYVNAGDIFRQLATDAGLTLAEYGRRAESDGRIDRDLDARMLSEARQRQGAVLEGRLTGWMVHRHGVPSMKVWLEATREVRAGRVSEREGLALASTMRDMVEREESESSRYNRFHGVDIDDLSIYDLVIDTNQLSAAEVAEAIAARLLGEGD